MPCHASELVEVPPFSSLFINSSALNKALIMNRIENIRCSNCGSPAERHHLEQSLVRTQCAYCDYLMITCSETGRVIEAYAPGLSLEQLICH
jgi:hypothetical protein